MGLRVLGNNVLVKRDEIEKYKGMIELPDIVIPALEKVSPKGTVVAVGKEVKEIKVGNRVYFQQFGGSYLEKDQNLLILREEEILGFVDD